jgi:prevent-host-death family protein
MIVTTMMTTGKTGVRELKRDAPRLVERAASGERIVITRYGKPRAQLGPVEEQATGQSARTAVWQAERRAFDRLAPGLERRYRGRWVAILGGRVAGSDTDLDRLYERVWRRHRGRVFFIARVGAPPAVVDMPGFEAA